MGNETTTPAVPAPAPGASSSEFTLTKYITIAGLVLTTLFGILSQLQGIIPAGSKVGAIVAGVLAAVTAGLTIVKALGYTDSRTQVKVATAQAAGQAAAAQVQAQASKNAGAAAAALTMMLLVFALGALLFTPSLAHAQALGGALGDPCADGYDSDAGVTLMGPGDGGPALPAAICAGQRAPAHGVYLTVDRAAALAAERAELRAERDSYKDQLTQAASAQPAVPSWVWMVTCIVGTAASAVVAVELKK